MRPVASATSLIKNRRLIKRSGDLLSSSPPAEKAAASQDQARKASTNDGAGHRSRGGDIENSLEGSGWGKTLG
jgi:hypothetical protein